MQNRIGPKLRMIAAASAALWLSGCGGSGNGGKLDPPDVKIALPPAVAAAKQANAPVPAALVAADNAFGLNLLRTLQQQSPADNVTVAPLSAAIALQIILNGSAAGTRDAMTRTLQLGPLTADQVNTDNAALQAALTDPDPEVTLTIVNSLWMHLGNNPVLPGFQQINTQFYGSEVGDLAGAPADINAWVSKQTQGEIQNIAPAGDYSQVSAFVVSAAHFHGLWTTPFPPANTQPGTFTAADGAAVTVDMMHTTGMIEYLQTQNLQMIRLPFGAGHLSMLILLPDDSTDLGALVTNITADLLDNWTSQLQPAPLLLALPKFTAHSDSDLMVPLINLGMGIAFDCFGDLVESANFSNLISTRTCISTARHSASVQVDETGATATGATGVGVGTTAAPPQVSVDHPFLYFIRDDDTHVLLFAGTMLNPSR